MSTNDAVFHRRNKQIEDAIDVGNLKQALQLIEKRIKKGEDTSFLKAWKAHVLHRHADDTHQQRGITETLALCKAEPAVTDLDTLDILYETLQRVGGHEDTMRSIWERAAKAKPQDLDIQTRWFEYAFEKDDWKSAQKAAMSLQNNFPKKRNYYIWAIFLCYLLAVDEESSDMDRKLFGTLAYRMVSKAAESVPSDPKELLSPPRAIQSAEELLLLVKIYESQGRHSEIVKILDSENLGIKSKMVQSDWSFIGVKLSSLEKAEMWAEGLSYTKELLAIPFTEEEKKAIQERDDWAVWHLLVTATQKINSTGTTSETQKFISEFIAAQPKSRNAQLAHLDLTHSGFQSGSVMQEDLLSACQGYFDHSKNKLYCFSDILGYIPSLNEESVVKLLNYASKNSEQSEGSGPFKGVAVINALKLEYCFLMSSNAAKVSREKVEDFVSRCLKAYRKAERPNQSDAPSTIESQPSDDLCVLAAMGLVRFSSSWSPSKQEEIPDIMLIRAAAILERLIVDSPHNYQCLLLLVRLYLRLGAGSLALKTFSKLSVKQLQFETVAHNLFTRLSTIHPHSAPPIDGAEYKDFNPQSAFVQALNFYRSADLTSTRQRSKGLDYGSYVNIEGTIELQKRLRQSVCRRMWALSVKQTQRLAGGDPIGRFDDIARDSSPLIDQRTFDAFMNCEAPSQPTFEELVRLGPLPQDRWVRSAQLTDKLLGILKDLANQKPISVAPEVPSLDDLVGTSAESDMTIPEIEGTKTNLNLLKLAVYLSGSKSVTTEQVDESLNQVEEWLNSKLKAVEAEGTTVSPLVSETAIFLQSDTPYAPTWRFFHTIYSVLDSVKAAASLFSIASKKGLKNAKLPKDRVASLLETARKVHQSAQGNARALKKHVSESGRLGSLIDLVTAGIGTGEDGPQLRGELEKTLDTSSLELFCGELMESWDEALGGVLAVRL
ncbi:N-acetyltransferase B complex non catalytic subunit-domain-containing protein [Aspergillus pseudodeflectus]|uniref:N-acetyltransferase B complex non catalytic subunit-domain-containing protein n=1 Tax=Aspergillus pseudodeflectus TaxID=176178 RepID=A0ABR4JDN0_9EURO